MKYEILTSFSKELRRRGQAAYALMNICPMIADYLSVNGSAEETNDPESELEDEIPDLAGKAKY